MIAYQGIATVSRITVEHNNGPQASFTGSWVDLAGNPIEAREANQAPATAPEQAPEAAPAEGQPAA